MAIKVQNELQDLAARARELGWQIHHEPQTNSVVWADRAANVVATHSPAVKGRVLKKVRDSVNAALETQFAADRIFREAEAAEKAQQQAGQEIVSGVLERGSLAPLETTPGLNPRLREPLDREPELRDASEVGPRFNKRFGPIAVAEIKVLDIYHGGYQRPPAEEQVIKLAMKFSWDDFGYVVVSFRDGAYWVVDGQHRLLGLELTDLVQEENKGQVPALIYEGMTIADEADLYLRINTDRKNTHAMHAWKARLVSDEKVAEIEKIVEKEGFSIKIGGQHSLTAISRLERIYDDFGPEILTQVLRTMKAAWYDDKISAPIIEGLGYVLGCYANVDEHRLIQIMKRTTATGYHARARYGSTNAKGSQAVWVARILVESYNGRLSIDNQLGSFDDAYALYVNRKRQGLLSKYMGTMREQYEKPAPGSWLVSSRQY